MRSNGGINPCYLWKEARDRGDVCRNAPRHSLWNGRLRKCSLFGIKKQKISREWRISGISLWKLSESNKAPRMRSSVILIKHCTVLLNLSPSTTPLEVDKAFHVFSMQNNLFIQLKTDMKKLKCVVQGSLTHDFTTLSSKQHETVLLSCLGALFSSKEFYGYDPAKAEQDLQAIPIKWSNRRSSINR